LLKVTSIPVSDQSEIKQPFIRISSISTSSSPLNENRPIRDVWNYCKPHFTSWHLCTFAVVGQSHTLQIYSTQSHKLITTDSEWTYIGPLFECSQRAPAVESHQW